MISSFAVGAFGVCTTADLFDSHRSLRVNKSAPLRQNGTTMQVCVAIHCRLNSYQRECGYRALTEGPISALEARPNERPFHAPADGPHG
jgi:hypothetical protein